MTILSLIISLLALALSSYGMYGAFRKKIQEDKIIALTKSIKKGSYVYIWGLYRMVALFALAIAFIMLIVPFLGLSVVLAFIFGLIFSSVVAYIASIFIIRLNANTAEKSSYGLIDTFKYVFDGGSTLGAFVFSSALFFASAFFVVFAPEAIDLLAFALGVTLLSVIARISGAAYVELGEFSLNTKHYNAGENGSNTISRFVAKNTAETMGGVADMLETIVLGIVGAMIFASLLLPGAGGAVALPLLIASAGLVASFLSAKLIHIGVTTTITRNILFTVLSTLILSAVLFSPAIIWALSEAGEYSVLSVWGASVAGILAASSLFWLSYSYSRGKVASIGTILKKKSQELALKGTSLSMETTLQVSVVVIVGIILSYWLSGLLGIAVFTVSSIVLSGALVALNTFALISDSAYKTAQYAGIAEERIKVMHKLTFANDTLRGGVRMFLLVTSVFIALVLFLYNQHTVIQNAIENTALMSPITLAGMFMGGAVVYVLASRLVISPFKISQRIKSEIRRYINRIGEEDSTALVEFPHVIHFTTKSIMRMLIHPALFVILSSVVVGLLFRMEALMGFLLGVLVVGGFYGTLLILNGNFWASARGVSEETMLEENVLLGRHYRNIVSIGIISLIKASALVGLFVSVFIL